jgi:hypothetical protein
MFDEAAEFVWIHSRFCVHIERFCLDNRIGLKAVLDSLHTNSYHTITNRKKWESGLFIAWFCALACPEIELMFNLGSGVSYFVLRPSTGGES